MPYIKQDKRDRLDPHIKNLITELAKIQMDDSSNDMEGNLNYVITALLQQVYTTDKYSEFNAAVGVVSCVLQEFYRRRVTPYENQKSFENGDVY